MSPHYDFVYFHARVTAICQIDAESFFFGSLVMQSGSKSPTHLLLCFAELRINLRLRSNRGREMTNTSTKGTSKSDCYSNRRLECCSIPWPNCLNSCQHCKSSKEKLKP